MSANDVAHWAGWVLGALGAAYAAYPALPPAFGAGMTRGFAVGLAAAAIAGVAFTLMFGLVVCLAALAGRASASLGELFVYLLGSALVAVITPLVLGLVAGVAGVATGNSARARGRRHLVLAVLWLVLTASYFPIAQGIGQERFSEAFVLLVVVYSCFAGGLVQPPSLSRRQRWLAIFALPAAFLVLRWR